MALAQDSGVLRLWWGNDGSTHYKTINSYGRRIELSERKWVRETVDFGEWIPGCLTLSVGYCFLCSWGVLGWIFMLLRKWKRERVLYDPRPS